MRRMFAGFLIAWGIAAGQKTTGPITSDRIVNALKDQQNWLTYWGDYTAVRHRDIDQINTQNVKNLRVEWIFQTGLRGGSFETVPLVVDGVMYFTGGEGTAFAIDALTGRQLWDYRYPLAPDM